MIEKHQFEEERTKDALGKLSSIELKKYIEDTCKHLSEDHCYPEDFRLLLKTFEASEKQTQVLFMALKESILKFKPNNTDIFLEKFRQISVDMEPLLPDKRASHLVMLELSNKCALHLSHKQSTASLSISLPLKLSEKEFYTLQYVAGHVIQKIYRKLRKSKHWCEDQFQQSIQLLQAFKIEKNDTYKLVYAKDRGGLWYVCMDSIKLFEQAELEFLQQTVGHVTNIDSKPLVDTLMKNHVVKSFWHKMVEDSMLSIDSDVGKDVLEQMLGLYIRVRSFAYAKSIREKHKLQAKRGKKRSLRNELKIDDKEES